MVSDAPLCARYTPEGVTEGPEVCATTAVPVPTRVAGATERPPAALLPRTGAGADPGTVRLLAAGACVAGVVWCVRNGRRRR